MTPYLAALLKQAAAHHMTEDELRAQRRSWVAGEAGIGSDADEMAYRIALEINDRDALVRLETDAKTRQEHALKWKMIA